jgi:hypothetical protein
MTRAVVFLTATLLLVSFGAVAQNKSSPSGGQNGSVEASTSAQNATPPSTQAAGRVHASQGMTTAPASKGIQKTPQGEGQDPGIGKGSAELPQTSTILPLLGLLGLGSLVAGLFARR